MPDVSYLLAALAVIMGVTFLLRAVPFAVIAPLRSSALSTISARTLPWASC